MTRVLEAGAPPTESRANGFTALMAAAMGGHARCVDVLLTARADPNAIMDSGSELTVLMLAAAHGHEQCARLLITAGAAAGAVDRGGQTAMAHAQHSGHTACVALLHAHVEVTDDPPPQSTPSPSTPPPRPPLPDAPHTPLAFCAIDGHSHHDSWHERQSSPRGRLRYFVSSSHPHFANLLQLILIDHGFSRAHEVDEPWSLMWHAGQLDPAAFSRLRPNQVVNKFPHANCLTTKSQLWATLARMRRKHGEEHYPFVPLTFVLPTERGELAEAMASDPPAKAPKGGAKGGAAKAPEGGGAAAATPRVWIVKPVAACRGQGISLHRSADGVPDDVAARRAVASVYIDPPYLVEGRKSDLRLYVLVTSWRPLVLYLHGAGLCRLATKEYALRDLDDTTRHLTNYAINKKSDPPVVGGAEGGASGPKIGLGAFNAILEAGVGAAAAAAAWESIDDAIVKTIIAAEPQMGQGVATFVPSNGCRCFQLFGFDVMLDASCRPWVLEVNLDPSLATDSALDLAVKVCHLPTSLPSMAFHDLFF